jgi:hypothetical protein
VKIKGMAIHPSCNKTPKAGGETTVDEDMVDQF